uniref:Uncharacterized protein n=1 Tax=Ditylenchus dipsaci TaxID=166011 RepID=A0A915DF03_9BILA
MSAYAALCLALVMPRFTNEHGSAKQLAKHYPYGVLNQHDGQRTIVVSAVRIEQERAYIKIGNKAAHDGLNPGSSDDEDGGAKTLWWSQLITKSRD